MKSAILLRELSALESQWGNLEIVEIGSIRNTSREHEKGDGHSTRHIAEFVRDSTFEHNFTTVDIKTDVCRAYMANCGLSDHVTIVESCGLEHLKTCKTADFIYLDGANDAEQTLQQFKIAVLCLKIGGVIVIDDCFPGSEDVVKCNAVVDYCETFGVTYQVDNNMFIFRG